MGFHAEALPKALDSVIEQMSGEKGNGTANLRDKGIEMIAVANRPGLSGSLLYVCANPLHSNTHILMFDMIQVLVFQF